MTGCDAPCAERKSAGLRSKLVGALEDRMIIREAVVAESMAKNVIRCAEIAIDMSKCPCE